MLLLPNQPNRKQMDHLKPKTIAFIELGFLVLALGLFLLLVHPKQPAEVAVETATTTIPVFPAVSIEAKSAYVYDALTGKTLFGKDAELTLPLASVTKIMTALTASQLLPRFMLVRITSDDIREEGDSGLLVNEEWNVQKLVDFSLTVSSNDGVRAIAAAAGSQVDPGTTTPPEALFVEKMNGLAKNIGLSHTYFFNQSGLDISTEQSGAYGSAKDMTTLVDFILKHNPHLLEATSLSESTINSENMAHKALNTDKSIPYIPNLIASKTGYTDLSGGNLVIAFNAGLNHPIIIAVLGSSYDGRFVDMNTLVNATLSYLSQ